MVQQVNEGVSLIILTYNQPDALALVLKSIEQQTDLPDEVIIADDGSTVETRIVIETIQKKASFPIKHVWHEDKGFRIASIRNKAVKACRGDFLIFSDGDLFFHPHFVADFKKNRKKNRAVIGSRVFLTKKSSLRRITHGDVHPPTPYISPEIEKNRLNSMRIPILNRLWREEKKGDRLRGGLIGIWKSDLENVNGWNEDFIGWGREDTELVIRLMNNNIVLKKIKFQALTYHLWHPVACRNEIEKNQSRLMDTLINKRIRCKNGLFHTTENEQHNTIQ